MTEQRAVLCPWCEGPSHYGFMLACPTLRQHHTKRAKLPNSYHDPEEAPPVEDAAP